MQKNHFVIREYIFFNWFCDNIQNVDKKNRKTKYKKFRYFTLNFQKNHKNIKKKKITEFVITMNITTLQGDDVDYDRLVREADRIKTTTNISE